MTLSLSIDLGQSDSFIVQKDKTSASLSRIVGQINNNKHNFNQPIYLKSRPNNNLFSVIIFDETGNVSTTNTNYIITLVFEKIK
jgi:hypothetical protein